MADVKRCFCPCLVCWQKAHCSDIIMSVMKSQIPSVSIVCSRFGSGAHQRKKIKLCVTGLCGWNSLVSGEFPAQRASNAENVSIWWRHHDMNGLIHLFISLSLKFPHVSRQFILHIDFRIGRFIHYETPCVWLTCDNSPLYSCNFLVCNLLSSFSVHFQTNCSLNWPWTCI